MLENCLDIYSYTLEKGKPYGYIYRITNNLNDLIYVGQTTKNIHVRFKQHCKPNTHGIIGQEIARLGSANFTIDILEMVETKENLDMKEIYWIRKLRSFYPNGYNLNSGGKGVVVSDSTKKKMRDAHLGKKASLETRRKISVANRNKDYRLKTHCKHGHPYDEKNTYIKPDGNRDCRPCRNRRVKKHQRKKF